MKKCLVNFFGIIPLFFLISFYFNVLSIKADNSINNYLYSYDYNGETYYSNESEDDAWYQAMLDNFEKGNITEEQIEEEYSIFSRRDLNEIYQKYDNQSEMTGSPVTYVNGYLSWNTSTNHTLPLKYMRVDLYNRNVIGSEWLATTYTDENGYYCFEFINDTSWYENGGYDIFIRCYPDSYTFEIARDWLFSFLTYYYFESDTILDVASGTTLDFNIMVTYDESNMGNRAFYLSQALVTAQRFAIEMGMDTDQFLHVIYPFTESANAFCYGEYSGIAKNFSFDFDVAMHEYGHFVEGVLGTYGSDLIDFMLYDPNHYAHTDHFYDKDSKLFAMNLTWSEAWATTFAQIAQQKYLNEYIGKVNTYGDIAHKGTYYEYFIPTLYSCEAQENAVIASLWDIFDSGSNETHDNLSMTYGQWWNITTSHNIQTLTDFFNVINTYYPQLRNQIGEIFEEHQISPSNLSIINIADISEITPPQFTWDVNGSIYNPNNKFRLVFYNSDDEFVYQTEIIASTLSYNQSFSFSLSIIEWNTILSYFNNVADLNIVVQGYHSDLPLSGPYNSKYLSISITFEEHNCDYSYEYEQYNSAKHKAICSCGDYDLRTHVVKATALGRFKPCVDCGYLVDTYNDFVLVEPLNSNNNPITKIESCIPSSSYIVLMDEDLKIWC